MAESLLCTPHSHGVKSTDKASLVPVVLGDGRACCPDKGWTKAACLMPSPSAQPAALAYPPLATECTISLQRTVDPAALV